MIDLNTYAKFLSKVAEEIDISPSNYQDAVNKYSAVGNWLEQGSYANIVGKPSIYPQGSFRLGTVVKPMRSGVESSYDIDLVCELPILKLLTTPQFVKSAVGDRIKEHGIYCRLLDDEGKRCWTLEYAEKDGVDFHLDVLPAIFDPNPNSDKSIAITNRSGDTYSWSVSNPKGYGDWFEEKNSSAFRIASSEQKRLILESSKVTYKNVDDVPDQLVRTPLQRSIQLLKRHRDVMFSDISLESYAPISIIITTLAAHFYQNESDTASALINIILKLSELSTLLAGGRIDESIAACSPIKRLQDGKWYVGNPVNPRENFADCWHEDGNARAEAFYSWVQILKQNLVDIVQETSDEVIRKNLSAVFGIAASSSHFDIIFPVSADEIEAPHIHISNPPKPWRM